MFYIQYMLVDYIYRYTYICRHMHVFIGKYVCGQLTGGQVQRIYCVCSVGGENPWETRTLKQTMSTIQALNHHAAVYIIWSFEGIGHGLCVRCGWFFSSTFLYIIWNIMPNKSCEPLTSTGSLSEFKGKLWERQTTLGIFRILEGHPQAWEFWECLWRCDPFE